MMSCSRDEQPTGASWVAEQDFPRLGPSAMRRVAYRAHGSDRFKEAGKASNMLKNTEFPVSLARILELTAALVSAACSSPAGNAKPQDGASSDAAVSVSTPIDAQGSVGFSMDAAVLSGSDAGSIDSVKRDQASAAVEACTQDQMGQLRCQDTVLQVCDIRLPYPSTMWFVAADCAAGGGSCGNGTCVGGCQSGTTYCTDISNERSCGSDGTWTTRTCPGLPCSGGSCWGCTLNARRCQGNTVQECSSSSFPPQWVDNVTCSGACIGGYCEGEACPPGNKRCNGNTVEMCDSTGKWQLDSTCPAGWTCSDGAGAICEASETVTSPDAGSSQSNDAQSAGNVDGAKAGTDSGVVAGTGGATSDASPSCLGVDMSSDPANCGACGTACASVQLAKDDGEEGIVVDKTNVYWLTLTTVMKAPLLGGAPTKLASGQSLTSAIAVDATSVYWGANRMLMKVPLAGGTPITLASSQGTISSIAVDRTSVYWTDLGTGIGLVMKVPVDGGPPVTLASGQGYPEGIVVDATNAYWFDAGYIRTVPLSGGNITTLVSYSGQSGTSTIPTALAIDATNAYWTATDSAGYGAVKKVPLSGGPTVMLFSGSGDPTGIAVDATSIYWTDRGQSTAIPDAGVIMKVPLSGGSPVALASSQANPTRIAVANGSIYWINRDTLMALGCTGGKCRCPGTQMNCSGSCSDTSSDSANCGACGVVCQSPTTCKSGVCTCTGDGDCHNQACVNGICSGDCAPGSLRCDASQVENCNSSGQWSLTTACPLGCRGDGSANCRDCQSGDTNCKGIVLQSCDTTGAYVDGLSCSSACVGGQCVQGSECNHGDARCGADGSQLCSPEGTWATPVACDPNATCTAGVCMSPPACERLASCCYAISEGNPANCQNLASTATASTCQTVLNSWQSEGFCF